MKDIVDFVKSFDLHTIIIVGIAFWWLNGNINTKITRLEDKINDMDRRLSRIEGAIYAKNCVSNDLATNEKVKN